MTYQPVSLNSKPNIVITDSGLGGLSVLADLEQLICDSNLFEEVKLVYFNSHPQHGYGYNSMKDSAGKAEVFNDALHSMVEKFNPDLILIACNTLSIVYPDTKTAKNSGVKILGIAEFAINMFFEKLVKDANSKIILYGTPTTINSNVYKSKLVELGISPGRIINQPCYLLETEIQNDPGSVKTEQLIREFTLQAKSSFNSPGGHSINCYAGFCCTHYGYSTQIFEKVLSEQFNNYEILNPNFLMSRFVASCGEKSMKETNIHVEVHSRVSISDEEIISIGNILKEKAPRTSLALANYNLDRNLFKFIPASN
jgi:glutamate racemase